MIMTYPMLILKNKENQRFFKITKTSFLQSLKAKAFKIKKIFIKYLKKIHLN